MDVAFLGLGIMGSRMAANLAKAGHSVRVWNRSPAKAHELAAEGCVPCEDLTECVRGVQVATTMLADPAALRETVLSRGMLASMASGSLWIDCSTVDPDTSRDLASHADARGIRFLDAPVSGSLGAAANGKLVFFVGGEAADIASTAPLFAAMGMRTVHAGPRGAGSTLKLVNNLFLAQAQAAWSETLGLANRMGLATSLVHDAILPTHVAPGFLTFKRPKIEARDWSPEFPLRLALKDIRLALAAAGEEGLDLTQAKACEALFAKALDQGFGDADISAVHEVASRG